MATRNDKEPPTIQAKLGFADNDLKTSTHDEILLALDENLETVCTQMLGIKRHDPPCPPMTIDKRTWEYAVLSGKYTVGFVDLMAVVSWEYELIAVGMSDDQKLCAIPRRQDTLYFEIKSTIPSLGELVRQIRFYQSYVGNSKKHIFVVVSPDTRWRDALESQGIRFIAYPFEI